jgi:hypothetical protein
MRPIASFENGSADDPSIWICSRARNALVPQWSAFDRRRGFTRGKGETMSEAPNSERRPTGPYEGPRPRDYRLLKEYVSTLLDPEFRPLFFLVIVILAVGTTVYSLLEDWSLFDSLYFSVVTLATIGYGDLAPTTKGSKLFTICYIFVGVGTLGVFISAVSRASLRRSLERQQQIRGGKAEPSNTDIESDL